MTANGYTSNPPSGGGGGPIAISDVTGLTAALADRATDAELTTGLATKAATAHTHAEADVTGLTAALAAKAPLASPTFTGTVSGVTASMVGLGNVTNTSDANKPVSTAQQTALDLKADLASPALTGNPTAPTQTAGNNSTRVATTAFVTAAVAAGGGGSSMTVKRAIVTSGDITPQNTSSAWQALTGGPTLSLAAAAGDYITAEIMGMLNDPASNTFIELAVTAGGTLVRYGSSGTGTPAVEGDPAFYPDTVNFSPVGPPMLDFVAQAGDINGGNVTVCFAVNSAGSGKIYASAAFPLRWRLINHGAVSVS